jgi:hypothetical protein
MLTKLGTLLVKGYGFLLAVAFGGFVGANLAGFVPGIGEFFFNPDNRPTPPDVYMRWIHGGWLTGAALATVAGLLHMLRQRSTAKSKGTGNNKQRRKARLRDYPSPGTVLGSAAAGGVGGGFLGMFLGSTLLFFWFSLAYSPFAPAEWGASISVERVERPERSAGDALVRHGTNHPIALYLFLGPTLTGLTAGGLLGGICKAVEKAKHRPA